MPRVTLICGQRTLDEFDVPDGTTLHDVMLSRNPESGNWPAPTICILGDKPVLRKFWETTELTDDAVAVFCELPMAGGGGSNPMQMVMMVAVMVASIYTAGAAAAAYATAMGVAVGSTAAVTVGALAGALVSIAGSILSSLLFSSKPSGQIGASNAEQASPTYSINGSGNQGRMEQPVPYLFGKMRVVPDIVANRWAQYINNEMYLYQVYGCGLGLSQQHSMSFGDVSFWKDGYLIDSAYTSESGDQYVNTLDEQLVQVVDGGTWYGPHQATQGTAMTINVTIDFPEGLCSYEYGGLTEETGQVIWKPVSATASFTVEYREVGATQWKPLASKEINSPTSSGFRAAEKSFSSLITGKAPLYREWEIRIRNTSTIPDTVSYTDIEAHLTYTTSTRKKAFLGNVSSISPSINVQIVEPGEKVTLFPDNIDASPSVSSQELIAPNADGHSWIGPFPTNAPGTKVNQILFSFVMPGGLATYDDKGKLQSYTIKLLIEYRAIDDSDSPLSEWETLRKVKYKAGTLTAQRRTEHCSVPLGRSEARVMRTSDKDESNKSSETILWESMISMIPGSLTYDQTVIAVKIKATNTVSQNAANNFAVVQTRKLPVYDRTTKKWTEPVPTRSWAAAISHICKASYGGQLTDRQIDLESLWAIGEDLDKKKWYCDAWIDGPYLVWNLLVEMCNAYSVVPRPTGTVLSFVMDKANRPVRHVFTPYDIVRGSFVPSWNTFEEGTPDDVLVSYLDETANYLQRDVRSVLPESESRNPANQNYLGVVNRDHAHKIGLYKAACNRWRRLGCEFDTEGVGRILNLGDVVSVTHPRFRDTASGTLKDWDESTLILKLSGSVTVDAGIVPYMSLTMPNGLPWGPVKLLWVDGDLIRFDPKDYAALLLQGFDSPFPWITAGSDRVPTVWTFQQGREYTRRYIITGIRPQSVYRYHISCINDSDMIDKYEKMPTPPWDSRGNLPVLDTLPAPSNLQAAITSTDTESILYATWREVSGATSYEVQTSSDGITWVRYGQINASKIELSIPGEGIWFRVATVRGYDQSSWAMWQGWLS